MAFGNVSFIFMKFLKVSLSPSYCFSCFGLFVCLFFPTFLPALLWQSATVRNKSRRHTCFCYKTQQADISLRVEACLFSVHCSSFQLLMWQVLCHICFLNINECHRVTAMFCYQKCYSNECLNGQKAHSHPSGGKQPDYTW